MASVEQVLDIARSQIGYSAYNDPEPGSKYGRWLAEKWGESWLAGPSTSIWWCCMFVSWCLDQAGQQCAGFPSYNTDLVLSKNPPRVYSQLARPGDIVIWNWNGDGATDHIGFVEEHTPGSFGRLITIEGNYSNRVARVDRSGTWSLVSAVIRPEYNSQEEDDMFTEEDREMVKAIYKAMCVPQDASGRGIMATVADRLAWIAAYQGRIMEKLGLKK